MAQSFADRVGTLRSTHTWAQTDEYFFWRWNTIAYEPDTVAAIIAAARNHWTFSNDIEISLEANPGTVDTQRFVAIHDAGVARLSMGVQALNDSDLKFLGRRHSVEDARAAWRAAARIFTHVSFDLIYARPNQSDTAWRDELSEALRETTNEGLTHLSLYQLTMEQGTAMFDAHARGTFTLPDEDNAAALYDTTQELCDRAGYPAYEISNHASEDAACRHNLTYWKGGDYVGIGPGAHGRLTEDGQTRAVRQVKAPALWLKRVDSKGSGTQEEEALPANARAEELIMMGLRLTEGIEKERFFRLSGQALSTIIDPLALARLIRDGYLAETASHLTATPSGRLALNAVLRELLV
jgi:putative oxygen-independent coproporphyrinogen III oxidase